MKKQITVILICAAACLAQPTIAPTNHHTVWPKKTKQVIPREPTDAELASAKRAEIAQLRLINAARGCGDTNKLAQALAVLRSTNSVSAPTTATQPSSATPSVVRPPH